MGIASKGIVVGSVLSAVIAEANRAEAAADQAEIYSEVAMTAGWIYSSVASGEAARADGEYFWVVSAADANVLDLYLMGASTATATGKSTISSSYVTEKIAPSSREDLSFAVTAKDSEGQDRIILGFRATDGNLDDSTAERIAERLSPLLPPLIRPSAQGLWDHPSGDSVPYKMRNSTFVSLGSSSAERSATFYQAMSTELGASTFIDLGDGGTVLEQMAAAIGSTPATVSVSGGVIPATGSVITTLTNILYTKSVMLPIVGTIAGVHGTLSWSIPDNNFLFLRTTDGSEVAVPVGTKLIPDASQYRAAFLLLEGGKNNITSTSPVYTSQQIIDQTAAIRDWMAPYLRESVVMGHFANGSFTTPLREKLAEVNSGYAAAFGDYFIDQQAWLTSSEIWTQLAAEGYTPTSDDLNDQLNGDVPRGLMVVARDHLTTDAYEWRAKYLVKPHLKMLSIY